MSTIQPIRQFSRSLGALTLLLCVLTSATAWAWDGQGTEDIPYLIKTTSDLDLLAERVNSGSGDDYAASGYSGRYFMLANDIEYEHTTDWNDANSEENNYTAIGNRINTYNGNPFKGTFDGCGHTVKGIRIYKSGSNSTDHYQGLFGYVKDGTVKSVTLADARITGHSSVGGIVGSANADEGSCSIENCHVLGNVAIHAVANGSDGHGGISGGNGGVTINLCTCSATLTVKDGVTDCSYYGGIVGVSYSGIILNNVAIGCTIPAVTKAGAIIGENNYCTTEHNYYSDCTVGTATTGIGCGGTLNNSTLADITDNDGAVPGILHTMTFTSGVTAMGSIINRYGTLSAVEGSTVTLTATELGYAIESAKYNDTEIVPLNGVFAFTMPARNVTVTTTFKQAPTYFDENGTEQTCASYTILTGNANNLEAGWYLVEGTVNFDNILYVNGDVHIVLKDNAVMNVGKEDSPVDGNGIYAEEHSINIYGQSKGANKGQLNVYARDDGIRASNGSVIINGGQVTVTGGDDGISAHVQMTINGGQVTATGNHIGIISYGSLTINGGQVTATGDHNGISARASKTTFGWTDFTDYICASINADGRMFGKAFIDEDGTIYNSDNIGNGSYTVITGKTLRPYKDNSDVNNSLLVLADDVDNTTIISKFNDETYNVALAGRTLYKDGDWNTLCLPFALGDASADAGHHFDGTPLEGATVMELDTTGDYSVNQTGFDASTGTLYLYFKDADAIEAGRPYIIKWGGNVGGSVTNSYNVGSVTNPYNGGNIENPVFSGVTVSNATTNNVQTFTGGKFVGSYSPVSFVKDDKTKLFLGAANTLYWPSANMNVNAFRAYFDLGSNEARRFVLNFDNEASGITTTNSCVPSLASERSSSDTDLTDKAGAWYDMQGRKLDGKPTKAGLYIYGVSKVAIK